MYLTESERKRIKALYEASTASGAGSYETPMGFKADRPEVVGELPDEMDMDISDDEGINIDVDELMGMLDMSEGDDKERMRQLHRENSVVEEQVALPEIPEISEECLACGMKSLRGERETPIGMSLGSYDYTETADEILKAIKEAMGGVIPDPFEFGAMLASLAIKAPGFIADSPWIALDLYNNKCDGGGTVLDCLSDVTLYTDGTDDTQ